MSNKKFEKWASGYSGFDGGNPKGKIWLCGIEWGGQNPKKEDLEKLFEEDVTTVPTGYECHTINMKFQQYNVKFIKVMASLYDIEFIKNNRYDKKSIEEFNNKEKFFTKDSNYLKLNLLPFNFPNVSEEKWDINYQNLTGFKSKKEYMDWSLNARFEMFQNLTKEYSPKIIITVGKTHFENYKNAFGYRDALFITERFNSNQNKEYKYFYDKENNRVMFNFPFFSGRYGLNSNNLLIESGKVIKNLLDKNNIAL